MQKFSKLNNFLLLLLFVNNWIRNKKCDKTAWTEIPKCRWSTWYIRVVYKQVWKCISMKNRRPVERPRWPRAEGSNTRLMARQRTSWGKVFRQHQWLEGWWAFVLHQCSVWAISQRWHETRSLWLRSQCMFIEHVLFLAQWVSHDRMPPSNCRYPGDYMALWHYLNSMLCGNRRPLRKSRLHQPMPDKRRL